MVEMTVVMLLTRVVMMRRLLVVKPRRRRVSMGIGGLLSRMMSLGRSCVFGSRSFSSFGLLGTPPICGGLIPMS